MNTRIYTPFVILFFLLLLAVTVRADANQTEPAPAGVIKTLTGRAYIYRSGTRIKKDLRIPTSDNTPEPGNRRVQVMIRQP